MNSRERVLTSFNHKSPDKMAIDFGSHGCSTMHASQVEILRKHFGLSDTPVKVWDVSTMGAVIEDDLATALGSDCISILAPGSDFGINRFNLKEWVTPYGQKVLVPEDFTTSDDGRGGLYIHPQGDKNAEPSGHMPQGALYFDAIEKKDTYDEDDMNVEDNLEEFSPISDKNLDFIAEQAKMSRATGKFTVVSPGGLGYGDASQIPGPALKNPKGIRSVADWYMAPLLYPEYVAEVFDRQSDIAIENLKKLNARCGADIDMIFTCGTDFGHQSNLFCSIDTFDELYMPYYKRVNSWIHENTSWKILKHSCGAVEPLISKFIEAGFDALNPVQCSAVGMDAQKIKDAYGKDIVFWGGGVDTQHVLPYGTPKEVYDQVIERCKIFSKDGGYVFNTIHVLQSGVPAANILSMLKAIEDFNG